MFTLDKNATITLFATVVENEIIERKMKRLKSDNSIFHTCPKKKILKHLLNSYTNRNIKGHLYYMPMGTLLRMEIIMKY